MVPITVSSSRTQRRRILLVLLVPLLFSVADPPAATPLPDTSPSVLKPFRWSLVATWEAEGDQAAASLGAAVATAGDVNGDGFSDLLVGAPLFDDGLADRGRVTVYMGSPTGPAAAAAWTTAGGEAGAEFGRAASTAGDVNGDGYADVIIGAPRHDGATATDTGRALVYHGSAAGLAGLPAWVIDGDQAGAELGRAATTAGDVNGDGYADVIVCAPRHDGATATDAGRAFVYHGSASGLAGTPAWTFDGDQAGAELGSAVATAGDVNADGFADVIVGAPHHDGAAGASAGRVLVFLGSPSGLASAPAWTFDGDQADAAFGSAVGTAGDVDGDGYADVAIGAPGHDGAAGADAGRVLLFAGSASGLAPAPAAAIAGDQAGAHLGIAVATAGDANGDGFADVLIGASEYDAGQVDEGRVYLHVGSAAGLVAEPSWTTEPEQPRAAFGAAVATAGDVNGDGFSDVLAGAPAFDNGQSEEGRAYLYRGRAMSTAATPAFIGRGAHLGADFGVSVAGAGDVNGDGFSDAIIGSRFFNNGQPSEGRILVYHGAASGLPTDPAWSYESNQASTLLGYSVGSAGDVNGDGYADVIAGGYGYDGDAGVDEGVAFVFLGSPSGLLPFPDWVFTGGQGGARLGIAVASAGDVNGDGYADIIVGADLYDTERPSVGRVDVFHGSPAGLPPAPSWSVTGTQSSERLGTAVASAGDVNGDGFSDVVIGAPGYSEPGADAGRAYVYYGSPAGLGAFPAWQTGAGQAGAAFGRSVASAGDMNGDRFSDLLIGAPGYDAGEPDEGAAFLYAGSEHGLSQAPLAVLAADQPGAEMGFCVASAGDVDGDGMGDILAGAWRFDNGESDEGRVFLYHGIVGGPGPVAHWLAEGNQTDGEFGFSVSGVGDVNGDGFGDVLVGAPGYDSTEWNAGSVYLYLGNDGDGVTRCPRQLRFGAPVPIFSGGQSDYPSCFRLDLVARSPAGRGPVRLEWEVKPAGQKLDGTNIEIGSRTDSGTGGGDSVLLVAAATGLVPQALYHWRVRIATDSPFFPRSPWLWLPYNASSEADVLTGPIQVAVPAVPAPRAGFALAPATPSPFRTSTLLQFSVPARVRAVLRVYDVGGHLVREVLAGELPAGDHEVRWDGCDRDGVRLPAGVYFARLDLAGDTATARLVLVK